MNRLRELITEDDTRLAFKEKQEREIMDNILATHGYSFIYGGGSFNKGHGYWIQQNGETVKHAECELYGNLNECFWVFGALIDRFKTAWNSHKP